MIFKNIFRLLLLACVLVTASRASAQGSNQQDTMMRYYNRLVNSAAPADQELLSQLMYDLLKTKEEKNWITAQRFFYQLKKVPVADSIKAASLVQFPEGSFYRDNLVRAIYDEENAAKKEALYQAYIKRFPASRFAGDSITYDYMTASVGTAFAGEGNVKKALQYANLLKVTFWRGQGYMSMFPKLVANGHKEEAKMLLKRAIDDAYSFIHERKNWNAAKFAAMGYNSYLETYAQMQLESKDYKGALKTIERMDSAAANEARKLSMKEIHARALLALGQEKTAFAEMSEILAAGMATPQMKEDLKKLYLKFNGKEGYDEFMAAANKAMAAKIRADLSRQMIRKPAPAFTLTDVEGNQVALADLKGKTVVVDFWATWCVPCKKSFPAMKLAMDRLKEDKDVKFLYIHTWERGDSAATANAKKYVVENKYPFQVLMDLQNKTTGENKVVQSYEVEAIPTKFVIDKDGNIRFKFLGFSNGEDAAVEEVVAMIELAKKG